MIVWLQLAAGTVVVLLPGVVVLLGLLLRRRLDVVRTL